MATKSNLLLVGRTRSYLARSFSNHPRRPAERRNQMNFDQRRMNIGDTCNLCNTRESTQVNPIQGAICNECYTSLLKFTSNLVEFVKSATPVEEVCDLTGEIYEVNSGRTMHEINEFIVLEDLFDE